MKALNKFLAVSGIIIIFFACNNGNHSGIVELSRLNNKNIESKKYFLQYNTLEELLENENCELVKINQNDGTLGIVKMNEEKYIVTHIDIDDNYRSNFIYEDEKSINNEIEEQLLEIRNSQTGGLGIEQVNYALMDKFKDRDDIYVVDPEDLTGIWEFDNKYIKKEYDRMLYGKNIKFIVTSYSIDNKHQVALILDIRDRDNKKIVLIDSFGFKRRNNITIENLKGLLNIKYIHDVPSYYEKQPYNDSWECGVHTFNNIDCYILNKIYNKPLLKIDLDKSLEKILKHYINQKNIAAIKSFIKQNNLKDKVKLLSIIEEKRFLTENFQKGDGANDNLKKLADTLQKHLWGNTDRKEIPENNSGRNLTLNDDGMDRRSSYSLKDFFKSYKNHFSEDKLGIKILAYTFAHGIGRLNSLFLNSNIDEVDMEISDNHEYDDNVKNINNISNSSSNINEVDMEISDDDEYDENINSINNISNSGSNINEVDMEISDDDESK